MTRRIRWPVLALALLAGLLLCAGLRLALVVASLDPQAQGARLREAARARTGHDLTVEGVGLAVLPRPTIALTGVRLGPAPGFGPEPLAHAARVRATVRLLPLLGGRVEVGAVAVEGLRVELVRGPTGKGSWETLAERLGGDGKRPIPGLRVDGASVRFRDLAAGRTATIEDLALEVGPGRAPALALEGGFVLDDPAVHGTVVGSARLDPAPGEVVSLRALALQVDLASAAHRVRATLRGDLEVEAVRARIGAPDLDVRLSVGGPGPSDPATELALRGSVLCDLAAGALWLDRGSLAAAGAEVGLGLEASGLPGAPRVEGALQVPRQDLGAALGRAGVAVADPVALSAVAGVVPFRWEGGTLTVEGLALDLAGGRVAGTLAARAFDPLDLAVDLTAEGLDLDRLRPAPGGGGPGLAGVSLSGRLRGRALRLGGVEVDALDLPVSLAGGRLRLSGARVTALGGTLDLDLGADLGPRPGRHDLVATLAGLDLARALATFGDPRGLSGTLAASGDLSAAGGSDEELRRTADGRVCLALSDGRLPLRRRAGGGAPAGQRGARARVASERLSAVAERLVSRVRERVAERVPDDLAVTRLGACFDLAGGVASTSDLAFEGDGLDLAGAGSIDLGAGTLDLSCRVVVGDLAPLGLRVQGSLDDPQVEVEPLDRLELVRSLVDVKRAERRADIEDRRAAAAEELRAAGGDGIDRLVEAAEQVGERVEVVRERARTRREGRRERRHEAIDKLRAGRDEDTGEGRPEGRPEGR